MVHTKSLIGLRRSLLEANVVFPDDSVTVHCTEYDIYSRSWHMKQSDMSCRTVRPQRERVTQGTSALPRLPLNTNTPMTTLLKDKP